MSEELKGRLPVICESPLVDIQYAKWLPMSQPPQFYHHHNSQQFVDRHMSPDLKELTLQCPLQQNDSKYKCSTTLRKTSKQNQ